MFNSGQKFGKVIWLKAWLATCLVVAAAPAMAEGSRSLYPAGYQAAHADGGRANLDLDAATLYLGVVQRRAFIYVYAVAGENILLGSRNRTAAGNGPIYVYNPQGFGVRGRETIPAAANFTCSTGTTGLIDTRVKELAGPRSITGVGNPTGYVPCVYTAPTTGIYGVLFSGLGGAGGPNAVIDPPATSGTTVSAWDVTVRSSVTTSTTDINGRVFTYALSAFTGNNGAGRRLYSDLYYVTDDGYRYRQTLEGIDPNGGTFFANLFGFRDQGQPLYKDIRGSSFAVDTGFPVGVSADDAEYPIFFSDVAPGGGTDIDSTLTAMGIPLAPKPPQVNSFSFSYPPASSSTSYVGQGGVFSFHVTDTISFQIIISRDGIDWDPATTTNRVLTGTSGTGDYSIVWDGKDNAGANFPVGTDYQFRITGRNGEAHFPFVDVEGNLYGGPVVTKLNGNTVDSLVYYDDRGYFTRGGTAVGALNGHICGAAAAAWPQPAPNQALTGLDSSAKIYNNGGGANSAYARWWALSGNSNGDCVNGTTQGFGDAKALNLWTYQTTTPQWNTFNVIDAADVKAIVSAPVSTTAGAAVSVNVAFGNVGSQNAGATAYSITLPTGLTGVTCTGATCNYNSASGAVTITGLPGSLSPAQWVGMTLSYTAPASGSVAVVATVTTTTGQGPNLAPDSATATTLVGGTSEADVLTTVSPPPSSVAGGSVSVPVTFANVGASTATITGYTVSLSPGLSGVTCSGGGVSCTYNAGTGAVTVTGLPATLTPGQSVAFSLDYTAPASGTEVTVSAAVATSTAEINIANNSATGKTTVRGTGAKPDVTVTVSAPAVATPGSAVNVAVSFGNVGDVTAAGLTYNLTLSPGLSGVSCPSPAVCTYTSATGAVTVSGLPASLGAGVWTGLTLTYNAPASGVVPTTATIGTTTIGETNTANNTATGKTTVVTASSGADVAVTLTPPASAAPGAVVNVPVNVSNLGPLSATGVTYTLTLPTGLSGVTCSGNGVSCVYNAGTGVLTLAGLPVTLTSGQSVPFTLAYTAPSAGSVGVVSTIAASSFDPNGTNNSASGTTTIVAGATADVTTTVSPPPTAIGASVVTVPVTFSNIGVTTAAAVTYTAVFSGSPTGVAITNGGVPCTYNSGTGAITGCGLPATLTPGQALNLVATYTGPASGTVGITSTITTSTAESNAANNSATASTVLAPATAPDMAIDLTGLPAGATVWAPYSGTYTCSNLGTADATALTTCTVSGLPAGLSVSGCTITPASAVWVAGNTVPIGQTVTCSVSGTPTTVGPTTVNGSTGTTGDSNAANNTASKGVTVAASTPPTALPDAASTIAGTPGSFNVSTNDTKPVGSTYTQTASTCVPAGSMSSAGVASYTAPAAIGATCTVSYQVCNPAPDAATCASSVLTVTASAPTLTAAPDATSTPTGTAGTFDVSANDTKPLGSTYTQTATHLRACGQHDRRRGSELHRAERGRGDLHGELHRVHARTERRHLHELGAHGDGQRGAPDGAARCGEHDSGHAWEL